MDTGLNINLSLKILKPFSLFRSQHMHSPLDFKEIHDLPRRSKFNRDEISVDFTLVSEREKNLS